MKGLIWKDLMIYRKENIKVSNILITFVSMIFLIVWIEKPHISVFAISLGWFPISMLSLPVTLINEDMKCNWNKRAISMAVTKKEIVASRYISCLIACVIEFIIILLINAMFALTKGGDVYYSLYIGSIGFALALVFLSFTIFTNYLSGVNASAIMLLGVILLYIISFFVYDKINIDMSILFKLEKYQIITMSLCIAFLVLGSSYLVSVFLYKRKHR